MSHEDREDDHSNIIEFNEGEETFEDEGNNNVAFDHANEKEFDETIKSTSDTESKSQLSSLSDEFDPKTFDYAKLMETSKKRKWRYFSLGVIHFTGFINALSFSIVLTSAKPYLDQMDPEAGTRFLGLYIASQSMAQLFASPLTGYLGNRFGSVRLLLMVSTLILAVGFSFYASVSLSPPPRRWYLFGSRVVLGLSGGLNTLCFSYNAIATTVKERTTALSLLQMSKSIAFIVGPLIQASFLPLGTGTDHPIGDTGLYWNVYTAPAWLAVLFCLVNILVLMPCVFTEHHMAKEEADYLVKMHMKKANEEDKQMGTEKKKPDKPAMVVCIVLFAMFQFFFNVLESLSGLLTIEQLGMSPEDSIFAVSIFFSAAGVLLLFYYILLFFLVGYLSRRIEDRKFLACGLVFLFLGPLCMYPYGGPPPPLKGLNVTDSFPTTLAMKWNTNYLSESFVRERISNEFNEQCANMTILYDGGGCPANIQPWCCETSAIHPAQMIIGFALLVSAMPLGVTMTNGILSKILGPYPQGTWTGMLGAGAALARIFCPLCVTNLYTSFGTAPTFGFLTGALLVTALLYILFYNRLVPYRYDLPTKVKPTYNTTANELNTSTELPD